jgi:SAM-dependent methyltransferase
MIRLSEDRAASTRPADAARDLVRQGPWPPSGGPLRRLARRWLLRLLRPYSSYQQELDTKIVDSVEDLDRRIATYDLEELQLVTEDLTAAVESLRARIAAEEAFLDASRALPYTAPGALEQFRDPVAGVVLGYRGVTAPARDAYREFEEVFRGPEERVRERQRVFVDLVRDHEPVLDAGCGRGEFLDLLRESGVSYVGVDSDEGMAERCRAKGHDQVERVTANEYLERLPDGQLGAVFSAQVIEHMPYPDLARFLELSLAKLRAGGRFVAETVNPHAPHALKAFWVDPTHRHPLFPETALVLCRLAGFASAYVFHPLGSGHVEDDRFDQNEYALVADKA